MSAIQRSRLRRWLGSAALLAAGLPLSAQPPVPAPLPMNPMPITSPQPAATNKDAPAPTVITPSTPVDPSKLADKMVNFEMRDKPWKNVLEWLCNETGMPIIANAIPTGSFTFYGNPKQTYRIPQVVDFLNDALTEKKYVIIRRQAVISVVPADQQIDPAYVPRITVDQLKNYGSTEIVQVIVQLKTTNADDLAPEVSKMMGPFKEVTPLIKSNQLLLQDSAVTLQRVIETIKQMEENENGQSESYSHKCEYIKAREAERILKELLGDPAAILRMMQAGQPPQGQPGNPNQPRPAPNVALPKFRPHYISVDDRLGVVLVSGSADKIAQAKSIMRNVDVPQYPGQRASVPSAPILKNYSTAVGAAESLAKTLKEIYKTNTAIRIESVGGNAIMVLAGAEDQIDIARLVAGGDIQSSETAIIPITALDVEKTATTLKGMFQDVKTGSGPYIEADSGRGAIIIKGTPAQVNDVRAFVKLSEGDAGTSPNMRIISLDRGNAAALAAEIERLMNQTRRNPVRIVNPNAEPTPPPTPKSLPQSGNGGGQDTSAQLVDPKTQPGTGEPVTISIIGNRIVITSKDPAAVQMASELARMIISAPAGEGEFEIIKLKNANATDAARIIDEMYNGPRTAQGGQQQQMFPFGNPFGGGRFGGNQGSGTASTATTTAKVRVIADPSSNSLLVKASPVDLLSIKKYLKDGVDAGDNDRAAMKSYVIGPLKAARAEEIADAVRDVYRDFTSSNSTTRGGGGGFNPFGGGMPAQKLTDANGNPRPAALTIGVNEPTNTIIVKCSESMYKEVKTLVEDLDGIAKGSPRTIKIVSLKGIDTTQLQQAIDALQAPRNGNNGRNNNMGGFGGFGGGGFGGGGGGGNRGGGGGGRRGGGGRAERAPDRETGGPGFFEAGVKDDREPASKDAVNYSMLYDPASYAGEEQQQPPNRPLQPGSEIRAPLETVDVQALEQLGVVILRTQTQADMEELEKLIKYLQDHAEKAEVQITLVPLKQGDATHVAAMLNQVFARVVVGPTGNTALPLADQRTQAPQRFSSIFGTSSSTTDAVGSILLLPVPRFNAIIVGAPKTRFEYVINEINKLDQPNAPMAGASYFSLRKAPASRVANQVRAFYATRYSNEPDTSNQIRITHDDASNTVIVQASPADLAEIRGMIERIDSMVSNAVNELRIVPLRNALPEELANTLMSAITQGLVAPSSAPSSTISPQDRLNAAFGNTPQQRGAQAPATAVNTTKTTSLRFYAQLGPGGTVESGLLEDVHITPEARSNSLIISCPPKTMDLIMALIGKLDVVSAARSEIKIFTLRKGDASQTATFLQQFFLGQQAARPATTPGAPGQQTPAATGAASSRPLLSLSSNPADGATLVDLKISVDDRSNSIIVAGSRNDLQVIEAIISKMDDANVQSRRNEVYKLRNAAAADVQLAISTFMTNSLTALVNAGQSSNFQQLMRNVVIVAEPISNSLLISAAPEAYEEVMRLIAQIDTMPPQVVIQCLIAEVRLDNDEEFGIELGLQSPILFQRSVLPNGVTVNNAAAIPGFNFNASPAPLPALGNSTLTGPGTPVPRSNSPGIVGFQGVGNLGVGRTSPGLGTSGLVLSAASDTFSMLIRALKIQGRLDVLSRPQIMTLDNQTAALLIGQNVPYVSGSNVTATGVISNNIQRRDVGVLLKVTPRITPDGKVLMRVFPEVSSVDPVQIDLGNGQIGTAFNTQEIETTVAAADNETVIIGGLIQTIDLKQENKVPGLGDLPYIGAAFRYRTQSRKKKELLVILTPHIVRSQEDMARVLAEEARRMDWIVGDVCRVHGPGGLENILPQPPCNPNCAMPMLNVPNADLPNCVPMITPQPGAPITVPSYLPGQPIRPAGGIPPSPAGSPVLPATYEAAPAPSPPPPPKKDKGKDSRPWVFQRGG